ncbi:hypothetical protein V6N11_022160 [Hibiscus sabdariffa]|uniref:Uncharacterized protein n=1 Tax=Hibiscus sabdariffa TaxID=183260 RepID=A0ABR2TIC2_9ROSI
MALGMASSRSVTSGELQPTIRTEDEFLELAHPRGIATLCPIHCSTCVAEGIRGMMTLPTRVLEGKSSYEKLYGRLPDYGFIKNHVSRPFSVVGAANGVKKNQHVLHPHADTQVENIACAPRYSPGRVESDARNVTTEILSSSERVEPDDGCEPATVHEESIQ